MADKNCRDDDFEHGVERLVGQAQAQGFPRKCSDPTTMARVAAALSGVEVGRGRARRKAA